MLALAKHGLERRDLPPDDGLLQGDPGRPGRRHPLGRRRRPRASHVVLQVELPVLLTIADVPHVLDPRDGYTVTPLRVTAWRGDPTGPDDPQWSASPEGERAFLNTQEHLRSLGAMP